MTYREKDKIVEMYPVNIRIILLYAFKFFVLKLRHPSKIQSFTKRDARVPSPTVVYRPRYESDTYAPTTVARLVVPLNTFKVVAAFTLLM